MTKIEKALTPEEWKALNAPDAYLNYDGDIVMHGPSHMPHRNRHGLAALALHDQPFGFTWEDVYLLEHAINDARERPDIDQVERLQELSDRISALLPPD